MTLEFLLRIAVASLFLAIAAFLAETVASPGSADHVAGHGPRQSSPR
jgi:hypothetical protein